ncbi:uncharacterized protein LOC107644955 isoform X1 [Arachis ipaensis]|uniref:uncharacterized protein LOC107644955 isoform X1 n=1 Tax=Arachis ipaensis TaxID=130454 RepID=UPI000A2B14B3|nr:uncharacterized protein LOC107644955 isoform X1 [Arachis ipaensis]
MSIVVITQFLEYSKKPILFVNGKRLVPQNSFWSPSFRHCSRRFFLYTFPSFTCKKSCLSLWHCIHYPFFDKPTIQFHLPLSSIRGHVTLKFPFPLTKNLSSCGSSRRLLLSYDASKNGVAQEAIQNTIRRASKAMSEQEARQILGVTEETPWEEIVRKYDTLFENNAKNGSFYLQSKVHRAKECLEAVHQSKGQGPQASSSTPS